jgi:carbon-monoxide dehydrogenase small subunit
MKRAIVHLTVNGDRCSAVVSPSTTLAEMLRDELRLTGTKVGCGTGDCGACTVLLNGRSVNSCLTLALEADGAEVTTIEGVAPSGEALHPVQEAFVRHGAVQCGFCTPGMIVSAVELLEHHPGASEAEIRHALGGHICRCTGYTKIVEAVEAVARGEQGGEA